VVAAIRLIEHPFNVEYTKEDMNPSMTLLWFTLLFSPFPSKILSSSCELFLRVFITSALKSFSTIRNPIWFTQTAN